MVCAFVDCFAGISGDMLLGALIDAGAPVDDLLLGLKTLPVSGWELEVERVQKGAVAATSVSVIVHENQPERHLSDIETIIIASQLPEKVKEQSLKVFQLLAEAEAKFTVSVLTKSTSTKSEPLTALLTSLGQFTLCICLESKQFTLRHYRLRVEG